ncbi:Gfo/Idh/MocA family protein [Paenibacillus aceris]|uniref:Dehydrogenase n=1 Tax=Paenibacillus aceris TaxID=869555 RepID=A0ABS4I6X6_9BACL|nr:Gfo/Idh/MocA family oxidoreductase [Paenibacillus aceris]MBP1966578.1 putative dehydrogenase [Paenibacillus aceris]NHW38815.1 Gfo/Idh/MocA family oxidoreductase [Paenibacillus aceris]
MQTLTAVLVGAGARGAHSYAPYALDYPHELKFVAIVEPDGHRRDQFAATHQIPQDRCFTSWDELFAQSKLADIMLICTQDNMHFEPTVKALDQGYHVLLEKPMSPDPKECLAMEASAKANNRLLSICHVLRYTSFWSTIKRLIEEGRIGEVVSIQLNENVAYWHIAHSFVRGNWNNSDTSSPMILSKSCHDMDVLSWLMDQPCVRVSSYGSLMHFHSGNAPVGSTDRCIDGCAVESTCPYSATRFYLGDGKNWARHFVQDLSKEAIVEGLKTSPYGRCVYKCDNNVVDHQVVNMEFENGATATFSMSGFTMKQERIIQIMGTKGQISGHDDKITLYDFVTQEVNDITVHVPNSGHGGGDTGIVQSFLREVRSYNGGEGLTSASASVRSHMMAFAAEASRRNHGQSIDINDFAKSFISQ